MKYLLFLILFFQILQAEHTKNSPITLKAISELKTSNPQIGVKLLENACLKDINDSCYLLGALYLKGKFVKKDTTKFFELINKACDLDHKEACYTVALEYYRGNNSIKVDTVKAIDYYDKSCSLGYHAACHSLGYIYDANEDMKRDISKAKKYYKEGCSLDNEFSCYRLGMFYYSGFKVKQNHQVADYYFNRSCYRKFEPSCDMLLATKNDTLTLKTFNFFFSMYTYINLTFGLSTKTY